MYEQSQPVYIDKRSAGMATASMILGIVSLVTVCCLYISIPCGALAIMLALLSKGGEVTMSHTAKIGMILGIIGVIGTIVLTICAVVMTISEYGGWDGFLNSYTEILNQYTDTGNTL